MNFFLNLLGGLFLCIGVVVMSPFMLLWYCVDLISMKFGGGK